MGSSEEVPAGAVVAALFSTAKFGSICGNEPVIDGEFAVGEETGSAASEIPADVSCPVFAFASSVVLSDPEPVSLGEGDGASVETDPRWSSRSSPVTAADIAFGKKVSTTLAALVVTPIGIELSTGAVWLACPVALGMEFPGMVGTAFGKAPVTPILPVVIAATYAGGEFVPDIAFPPSSLLTFETIGLLISGVTPAAKGPLIFDITPPVADKPLAGCRGTCPLGVTVGGAGARLGWKRFAGAASAWAVGRSGCGFAETEADGLVWGSGCGLVKNEAVGLVCGSDCGLVKNEAVGLVCGSGCGAGVARTASAFGSGSLTASVTPETEAARVSVCLAGKRSETGTGALAFVALAAIAVVSFVSCISGLAPAEATERTCAATSVAANPPATGGRTADGAAEVVDIAGPVDEMLLRIGITATALRPCGELARRHAFGQPAEKDSPPPDRATPTPSEFKQFQILPKRDEDPECEYWAMSSHQPGKL